MILLPPAEPVAMTSSPVSMFSTMDEQMELWGRLPGRIKLIGLAWTSQHAQRLGLAGGVELTAKPNELTCPGELKSSISLLRMMPSSVTASQHLISGWV